MLCDRDADCQELGDGFACEAGRCRIRVSCEDPEGDVAAFVAASKACETEDDCVVVESPCYTGETCSAAVALSVDHDRSEWDRVSAALVACRGTGEGGCSACALPIPAPSCVGGKCSLGGRPPPTCEERSSEAVAAVEAAVDEASRACVTDDDCTLADKSSACHPSCPVILSTAGARALASVIEGLDTGLCESYVADRCPLAEVLCEFPGTPTCSGGYCTAGPSPAQAECGDGVCDASESETGCPADCYCGDGTCDSQEAQASCPDDCPARAE